MGGMFGGPPSNAKYNLEVSVFARNLFNQVNLGTPISSLGSPLFGQSRSLAGMFFGGTAANRRLDMQIRFSF